MPAPVIITRAANGGLLDITKNDANLANLVASIGQGVPETTKGDIGVNNGATNVRLAVGATLGHVLKVNAATATGLEWGADSGIALKSDLALDSLTTGAALVANSGQHVNGIAQLRLLTIVNDKPVVRKYHTTPGDGPFLPFRGVTGAAPGTYVDNNGTTVIPAGGDGSAAWVAVLPHRKVSVEAFGASPSASAAANNTAFVSALSYVGFGGHVSFSQRYQVTGFDIPQYVTLAGQHESPGYDGLSGSASFNAMQSVLLLNPSGSITLKQGATLKNCVVYNSTVAAGTIPCNGEAGFSGTAIKMGHITGQQSPDMTVKNVMILGFTLGIHGLRCINSKIHHVNLDCTNGILCDTGGNPIDVQWVLGWPYLSVAYTPYTGAQLVRSGYGIKFQNNMDASRVQFCTFYDYLRGFILENCNGVSLISCGADCPESAFSNGLYITGACGQTLAIGCQFVANAVGIVFEPSGDADVLQIISPYFAANITYDIEVRRGTVLVGGQAEFASTCTSSINVALSTGKLSVSDAHIRKSSGNFVSCADSKNIFFGENITYENDAVAQISASAYTLPVVASASTVNLPAQYDLLSVSGTTNIFGFTNGWPGRIVVLKFQGVLTLTSAAGLLLNGNFTTAANSTLTLSATSATEFIELGRKA